MVFKMLILLGFFTVQQASFIHSDIHRSVVNRVDCSVQIAANRTVAFRVNHASSAREMHRNTRAKRTIFDRLEWEPSVCFHLVTTISNCGAAD